MKVPPKRKGNCSVWVSVCLLVVASMKVPPKRKGNALEGSLTNVAGLPQ